MADRHLCGATTKTGSGCSFYFVLVMPLVKAIGNTASSGLIVYRFGSLSILLSLCLTCSGPDETISSDERGERQTAERVLPAPRTERRVYGPVPPSA